MTIQDINEFNEIIETLKKQDNVIIMPLSRQIDYQTNSGEIITGYERLNVFFLYDYNFPVCIRKSENEEKYGRWMFAEMDYKSPYQLHRFSVWYRYDGIESVSRYINGTIDLTKPEECLVDKTRIEPEQIQPEIGQQESDQITAIIKNSGMSGLKDCLLFYLKGKNWETGNRNVTVLADNVMNGEVRMFTVNMDTHTIGKYEND